MRTELLADAHRWLRICEAAGMIRSIPPSRNSAAAGGPPDSWRTLYLHEDEVTARLNLRAFVRGWPSETEDLRADTGPPLAVATLPRDQQVADAHSPRRRRHTGVARHLLVHDERRARRPRHLPGRRYAGGRWTAGRAPPVGAGATWRRPGARVVPATARCRPTLLERRPFPDWYWS